MPGFLTHYISGQALLKVIDPKIQKIIQPCERLYNLGTQGPDIFFYYMPGHFRKRSRGIGTEMHQSDLGIFLAEMSKAAKEATPKARDIIFSYTAGFIMHYALDASAHPYVYAMTHHDNVPKIKNSADHRKFETAIDVAMLKLMSGKKPAEYSQWELVAANNHQMSTASIAMSRVLQNVYNRDIPATTVRRAMRYMVQLTRILQSRKGRRKRWMELVENMTIREPLFSSMTHPQEVADEHDYLNTKKSSWYAPWENDKDANNDSFVDRYHTAVEEGAKMIELLYAYVYQDMGLNALTESLGNRSLKTGMPCKKCEAS